ncbi:MAG TPA: GNAT family N-acetyltransferase [Acidimicrobiales bacterium]|nr:GNAT family N-acetyltransferase [Acidimicrobiales bacterium]
MSTTVRLLAPQDYDGWLPLWNGYLRFYRESLDDDVTRRTFERLSQQQNDMFGLVAETSEGRLVGLAHALLHPSTWSDSPSCYLEDLFVARADRGTGAALALIEEVAAQARRRGSEKLYWHTQEFNGPARSLYDQVASRVSFVLYERMLDGPDHSSLSDRETGSLRSGTGSRDPASGASGVRW